MISRYQIETLAPSWLAQDVGYLAALGEHLTARMDLNGYQVVEAPRTSPAPSLARLPVGTVLLRTVCGVEEFDVDMDDPAAHPDASLIAYRSTDGREQYEALEE